MADSDAVDIVLPEGAVPDEEFGAAVTEALARKGYCLVQTSNSSDEIDDAANLARKMPDYHIFKDEFVSDYLGKSNTTKVIKLANDTPDSFPKDALARCDRQLTLAGLAMVPYTDALLGFTAFGRYQGLVRVPFSGSAESSKLGPIAIIQEDVENGDVGKYIDFIQSRKVCMLYMLKNEGGDVRLFPKVGDEVTISITSNLLLLFRNDMMSFQYKPIGQSLALQSWMLGPVPTYQLDKVDVEGDALDEVYHVEGPHRPEGLRAQVMTLATRFPGETDLPEAFWNMEAQSTDACLQWPFIRFDEDMYYSSDPNASIMGKAYTNHGGFITESQLHAFANEHFNISDEEAHCMSTNQRMTCEVAYEALWKHGWRRRTLNGAHIGFYIGDVGADWHSMTPFASIEAYDAEKTACAIHSSVVPTRISYAFNIKGPTMTFDTACSASLVATHHCHLQMINGKKQGMPNEGGICGGTNTLASPGFVGNCSANMLSHIGRSFTFDRTADGYQRGEGTGMMYVRFTGEYADFMNRLASVAGTCANQDGRSASLTAPNGPSQQAVIRHSLRFAEIEPEDVTVVECHGTGTALGDPIEVGAVMAVMEGERDLPLPHTSAKSNIAHLESAAGIAGVSKCLVILLHSCATPNVHLKSLNPHLESQGFPQSFEVEIMDTGLNSGYAGVSSFGFGGTNSRGDFYARAIEGPRMMWTADTKKLDFVAVTCPRCMGPMCWRCGVAIPTRTIKNGEHVCTLVREDPNYEWCSNCYDGGYKYGEALPDLDAWNENEMVFIKGTWNGWGDAEEMEMVEEGRYVAFISLSQKRWEQFQLLANNNPNEVMYPAWHKGSPAARIMGPDEEGAEKNWLIDGRPDNVPPGTVYKITYVWGSTGSMQQENKKSISWEIVSEPPLEPTPLGKGYKPTCYVVGSWKRWAMEEMPPTPGSDGFDWQTTFLMGEAGTEEFQLIFDRDWNQAIYPTVSKAEETSIPIRGPNDSGSGKNFLIRGVKREPVTIRLTMQDSMLVLTATSPSMGEKIWETIEGDSEMYYVTGHFNDWSMSPMKPDDDKAGIYRFLLSFEGNYQEEFQIAIDGDWGRTLHPSEPSAGFGESIMLEPDGKGEGLNWCIHGEAFATYEIVLNLNEADKRRIVTWGLATNPAALEDAHYYKGTEHITN
jgi:polyketide synthase-associated protein